MDYLSKNVVANLKRIRKYMMRHLRITITVHSGI